MRKYMLCEGRHEMPTDVKKAIFGGVIDDPTDVEGLEEQAYLFFSAEGIGCNDKVAIYVTGLTVALIAAINAAKEIGIKNLFLYHYNRETGEYFKQEVL